MNIHYQYPTALRAASMFLIIFFSIQNTPAQSTEYNDYTSSIIVLMKNHMWKEAAQKAQALSSIYPDDHSLYYLQGVAYGEINDLPSALQSLSKAIKLNRNKGDAYFYRGLSHLINQEPQKAVSDLTIALKDTKTPIQISNLLVMLRLEFLGHKPTAANCLADLYFFRARALQFIKQYPEALSDINKAMSIYSSHSPYSFMTRGDILFLLHNYSAAYNDYQEAVALGHPNIIAKYNIGVIDFYYGNYNNSLASFNEVYKASPSTSTILNKIGISLLFAGNITASQNVLLRDLEENKFGESAFHLAYIYHNEKNFQKASEYFLKAVSLDPGVMYTLKTLSDLVPKSSRTKNILQEELNVAEKYLGTTNSSTIQPVVEIESKIGVNTLSFNPNPVQTNKDFSINIAFTANIQGDKVSIPIKFFFTITQGDEILFTSEQRSIKVTNGRNGEWIEKMTPVPTTGVFRLNVYAKHKKYYIDKSQDFRIE